MNDLTTDQMQELNQDLLSLGETLRIQLNHSEDGSKPVDLDQPIGRLSRMDALQQQHMTQANRSMAQRRLQQVEAALARHQNGEYGTCLECEESIGFARLKARPESLFCIACQSLREKS